MNNDPGELMSAAAAAALLANELGGTTARWETWLANDRKPGRKNLLPPMPGPGRPRYPRAAVVALIAAERAKVRDKLDPLGRSAEVMRAFGIGEGGTSTGRPWSATVTGQLDEQTSTGFVQVCVRSPLLVFRLAPGEARELASQLLEAAGDADHIEHIAGRRA